VKYNDYIVSKEWRSKHKEWLVRSQYRCSMFPWINIKKHYNIHHMNYSNLGNEKLYQDVIPLSHFAHRVIIHGILSGFKRPRKQKKYPNSYQQLAHCWCCIPIVLRGAITFLLLVKMLQLALIS
jgi:hypothetical protein